ncbi:SIR2 family protein [Azotobacter chroococcum]
MLENFRHDAPETIEMLSEYFRRGTLVPVFGAGFTVGETAQSGARVPSGTQLSTIMLEQLTQNGAGLSENDHATLNGYKFSDICEIYFDQNILPQELTKKTIHQYFYNVSLAPEKVSLIKDIDWKYIYTLNIDNAIERHSGYTPIYPYDANLSNKSRDFRPIYKLHGDVFYEVTHSSERLVFRKASYLESIETNRRMLEILEEDLLHKNILFIGCSLTDEDDIAFLVSGQRLPKDSMTRRIIFRSEAPGPLESSVLRRHGVNTVILIENGRYDQIYSLIQRAYSQSAEGDAELEKYAFQVKTLDTNSQTNQDF